ncbi:MAG TPA: hypothetical protein VG867_07100 [Rhizomicrobium sp.]|nr:hypothetical protein [Rhizomicrobium sp.]
MDSSAFLNLVSAGALLAGLLFTGFQIRMSQRQRAREGMLQLMQSFRTPEFAAGFIILADLPDALSKPELEARLGEKILSIRIVLFTIESIGSLVQKREIPLDLVEDFFRGPVILAWRKTEQYVSDLRAQTGLDTVYEYVQWLAERLGENDSGKRRIPAYIAHRDWTP